MKPKTSDINTDSFNVCIILKDYLFETYKHGKFNIPNVCPKKLSELTVNPSLFKLMTVKLLNYM